MSYFNRFPNILYKFGTEDASTGYQDLSLYVDLIDQLKDQTSLYRNYFIQDGVMPDQVSMELYNNPNLYWTFELINDKLRESGWPLSTTTLDDFTQKQFPHTTLTTRSDLTGKALPGHTITGLTSNATATVIARRLDFGQLIVDVSSEEDFQVETIRSADQAGATVDIAIDSVSEEYNSTHHWEDANGEYVDVDPAVGTSAIYNIVTFADRYQRENELLREIRVIKPSAIREINKLFQRAVRS